MSRRSTRRDGPTTMRTVGSYEVGAPPPPSGKKMEVARKANAAVRRLEALMKIDPTIKTKALKMLKAEKKAVEILAEIES